MIKTLDEYLTRFALVFNSKTKGDTKWHFVKCPAVAHNLRFQLKSAMSPYPHYLNRNAVFGKADVVQFLFNNVDIRHPVLAGIIELMKDMKSALVRCVFFCDMSSLAGGCCYRITTLPLWVILQNAMGPSQRFTFKAVSRGGKRGKLGGGFGCPVFDIYLGDNYMKITEELIRKSMS
jgi:hypothetical protein